MHIAHFKVVYGKGIKRRELLSRLEAVRKTGLRITADIYPYTASYTTTAIVFPAFAKPPFKYRQVKKHKRAELAAFLRKRVKRREALRRCSSARESGEEKHCPDRSARWTVLKTC